MIVPSRRMFLLLGAVAVLEALGFLQPKLAWIGLALCLMLAALSAADAWLAGRVLFRVRREVSDPLHQAEPAEFGLAIEHDAARAVRVFVRDDPSPLLGAEPWSFDLLVPAGAVARCRARHAPRWRGTTKLRPPGLRALGPLGLGWSRSLVGDDQPARILPQVHFEGETGLLLRRALRMRLGANPMSERGISTELYALREYLPGDDYRKIHWKQTARLNRPVTRENTWEQHQHLLILLDCGRPMAATDGGLEKLDHALAAVIALMRVAVAHHDSATLVLFSKEIRRVVRVDRRTRSFTALFRSLENEHADLEEPDYREAAAWSVRRVPRRSLALVLTSVIDLVGAELLSAALSALALRHRPLLVNLEDPGLVSIERNDPRDPVDAFAKAAAMRLRAENLALGRRLLSRGVDLLQVPAHRLTLRVVEKYLDLKSRRRVG